MNYLIISQNRLNTYSLCPYVVYELYPQYCIFFNQRTTKALKINIEKDVAEKLIIYLTQIHPESISDIRNQETFTAILNELYNQKFIE